uniref:YadA family autotransporter adhesin n=1 Tax=Paraburkholderia sp. J67 TaxID=2805435 RepID=UPI002ABD5BC1
NINNGTIGLVQQATPTSTVTVAAGSGGTIVDFTNNTGTARTLTGVANGAVNASSVEAVNGSQLYNLANSTANAMGGGSTVNADGSISNPTYVVNGKTFNNTGDALTNIAGDITNINGQLANAVSYDSSAHDSITLGGSGSTTAVAIHNVAAGTADSDAVNVGQMNAAIADVTNIAQNAVDPMFTAQGDRNTEAASATGQHATAGGANANASGNLATAIGASSVASGNNASAFGANSNATGESSTAMGLNSNSTGNRAVAIGANSTASADNSVALGAGSVADRVNTVSVGSAGSERQITNVAAGTQGTDAVNLDQMNSAVNNAAGNAVQQATQQSNAYTNQQIGVVRNQMNALGATAMASSSLIPNARAEGNFQMAVAAGTYGGQSALALGANWYVSDRVLLNAHVARSTGSGGSTGASVGATIGF